MDKEVMRMLNLSDWNKYDYVTATERCSLDSKGRRAKRVAEDFWHWLKGTLPAECYDDLSYAWDA